MHAAFFLTWIFFLNSLFYSLLHWLAVIIWLPQNDWILINRTLLSNLMETGTITSHTKSSILSPPSFKTFRKNKTYHVISLDCLGSGHSGRLCQFNRRWTCHAAKLKLASQLYCLVTLFVHVNVASSSRVEVSHGVLGPTAFTLYMLPWGSIVQNLIAMQMVYLWSQLNCSLVSKE